VSTFFLDDALPDDIPVGSTWQLTGGEAHHAASVSRVRVGEQLAVGNGRGTVAHGVVLRVDTRGASVSVMLESVCVNPVRRPRVILVQALAKGDRDELAVQAATELGVDAIVPWAAARSVSRWEEAKATRGRERWAAIARGAAKQSHRPWLPEVEPLATISELPAYLEGTRMLVLDPAAAASLTELRVDERDLALIVGPEGGISPEELGRFASAGADRVRLGPEVLRTSTAGPAAIAVLSGLLGRW